MKQKQIRKLSLVGLAVTAIAVALVGATVWGAMNAYTRQGRSDAVIRAADAVLATVTEAETAQRGWLLTGVETFLEPGYYDGIVGADERLEALRRCVDAVHDDVQPGRVAKVALLVRHKCSEMKFTVTQAQEGRRLFAIAHVREGDGRQVMEQIRLEIAAIKQTESVRIQRQYNTAVWRASMAIFTALVGLIVQAFTLSVIYMLTRPKPEGDVPLIPNLPTTSNETATNVCTTPFPWGL